MRRWHWLWCYGGFGFSLLFSQESVPWPKLQKIESGSPIPGTSELVAEGDLSYELVLANDRFLDRQIKEAREGRAALWHSGDKFPVDLRSQLTGMLGLDRDKRTFGSRLEYVSPDGQPLAKAEWGTVHAVRWAVLPGVEGAGILLQPKSSLLEGGANIIAIPDADQSPEEMIGLVGEGDASVVRLAQSGCRVLIPALVSREETSYRMTRREWLHRPAFVLGRHLLGYELHQVFAGADALMATSSEEPDRRLGVMGWGEGGLLCLYAAALDTRFDAACVSGYFGPRENLWQEPAEHNVFGLLNTFGDAEIASIVLPRSLVVETGTYPVAEFRTDSSGNLEVLEERPKKNGKPGRFSAHSPEAVAKEWDRLRRIYPELEDDRLVEGKRPFSNPALQQFAEDLGVEELPNQSGSISLRSEEEMTQRIGKREDRLASSIEHHHQRLLVDASAERAEYFSSLKTDQLDAFEESMEVYREKFRTEVIGDFELPLVDPNPRSRPYEEGEKTRSYEVVLDVWEGVFAYGILTVPKGIDLENGPRYPVVVCQHGLEGTPQDLIGEKKHKAYQAFATRLAERGYVTFTPQNGYKYFDRFRLQQFKSQTLGKTLFSIIVPQHEQITNWLVSLPFVDPDRIGFYGLSYGGKSAMRIPPLVDRYALSICSADFNEWVWKNAATDSRSLRYSYANKGEYEIFEWNLGGTFNYAEMAALICPRPFMVERGHFDGVAPDETVGYEFAKVRRLYEAQLGLEGRCEIEWFPGPHAINGEGTFRFLDRHLKGE